MSRTDDNTVVILDLSEDDSNDIDADDGEDDILSIDGRKSSRFPDARTLQKPRGGGKTRVDDDISEREGEEGREEDGDDDDDDDDDELLFGSPVFRQRSSTKSSISSSSLSTAAVAMSLIGSKSGKRSGNPTEKTGVNTASLTQLRSDNHDNDDKEKSPFSNKRTTAKPQAAASSTSTSTTATAKEQLQTQRLLEKERQKLKRAREREQIRKTKRRSKQEEKLSKLARVEKEAAAAGKFAADEMAVLFEPSLADCDLGRNIIARLRGGRNGEQNKHEETMAGDKQEGSGNENDGMRGAGNSRGYLVHIPHDGISSGDDGVGCIRWIRQDHLLGGAESAIRSPSTNSGFAPNNVDDARPQRMDAVAFVFYRPCAFLNLLERDEISASHDDYPLLRSWLECAHLAIRQKWERAHPDNVFCTTRHTQSASRKVGRGGSTSRVILVLHDVVGELTRQWNNCKKHGRGERQGGRGGGENRKSKQSRAACEEELHDAMVWLLMEHRVECTLTCSVDETTNYLRGITRALSEAPYYEQATELHCVKKFKSDAEAQGISTPYDKARDAWMKQLRQIPSISEPKARKLMKRFPTARTLMDAYHDPMLSEHEKRVLVARDFTDGRNEVKLSDCLYRLMTSDDPHELIS